VYRGAGKKPVRGGTMVTLLDRLKSITLIILFLISLALSFSATITARSETIVPQANHTKQLTTELAKPEASAGAVIKAEKDTGLVIKDGNAKLILGSAKRDDVRDFNQRLMMSQRTDNPRAGGIAVKFGMDF
jgi:hypothetical protein